jgi:hypothetical protein
MRIAVLVVALAVDFAATGCIDKPKDEDCVQSCTHYQELWFQKTPEARVEWESRSASEQEHEKALCKQNCQNSGRAKDVKCVLVATTYEAARKCTAE